MIQFMIFDNTAVNMGFVQFMKQEPDCTKLMVQGGGLVTAHGVTIDDILTALAAGQSRVTTSDVTLPPSFAQTRVAQPMESFNEPPPPGVHLRPSIAERRSRRFREPECNDPTAMRSIGRS